MKILSIETSCDETAISILEAEGDILNPSFTLLGNALFSQIDLHREYGGVYPTLAKREHSKNLVPLLETALKDAKIETLSCEKYDLEKIKETLTREEGLYEKLKEFLEKFGNKKPNIDLIVVTKGPGLAPALWVGVSFAKALSLAWGIKVIGENHMKGHIASVLNVKKLNEKTEENKINFPSIALLISGGHTEIVYMENWANFQIIGQTLDDAVGEAFDKTARMLGLPYPGGPEVSKKAKEARDENVETKVDLPRPMLKSETLDFSFSGLKTAVLYTIQKKEILDEEFIKDICREFEDAVTEVLIHKTERALIESNAKTLIIGGGVISNSYIRENFQKLINEKFKEVRLLIADKKLATDNAVMIAMAGYISHLSNKTSEEIKADGNLKIG